MAKKRAPPTKHSRAARRATSPSINTDRSLKNVAPPQPPPSSSAAAAGNTRPSVLAAHRSAGVQKQRAKPARRVSARARRRQLKGLEMAEAVVERTSAKLQRSVGRENVGRERRKNWDAINKDAFVERGEAEAEAEGEGPWETDEEVDEDVKETGDEDVDGDIKVAEHEDMDGDVKVPQDQDMAAATAPQADAALPAARDDDTDVIL